MYIYGRNFCIILCCKFRFIQVCFKDSLVLYCCSSNSRVKKCGENSHAKLFLTASFTAMDGLRSSQHCVQAASSSLLLVSEVANQVSSSSFLLLLPLFPLLHMIHGARAVLTVEWQRTRLHCGMWLRIFDLHRVPSN